MTDAGRVKIYRAASKNPDCPSAVLARYQGIMQPYCHGGDGCKACWDKWYETRQQELES